MRRLRKILGWTFGILGGIVLLLLLLAGGYILWLSQSVPVRDGGVQVAGLAHPVSIRRDLQDIPYIEAQSQADAYFALGFVHAQERLWQMDIYRRIAAGRLAEVVGPMAADADAFMRTIGLYAAAEADVAGLAAPVAAAIDAYTAGVNAYLAHHFGPWPPEFGLLFYEPEPWRPADSLAMGKLLGVMLTGNWQRELTRAALLKRLPEDQVEFLLHNRHDDPDENRPQRRGQGRQGALEQGWTTVAEAVAGLPQALPSWFRMGGASSAWVLSGQHTGTGRPILASDPHLAFTAPGIWYLARVKAAGDPDAADWTKRPLDLTGATTPGIPFHLLGQNGRVAWGATTAYADAADLYIERLHPGDPGRYATPAGPQPFATRQERMRVRFDGERALTIRVTRHGPVISDVQQRAAGLAGRDEVLALRHPTLRPKDTSTLAIYRLQFARNVAEFRDALRLLVSPAQNFLFADVDGGIGHVAAGWLPQRSDWHDGRLPAPGWASRDADPEAIPFDALPQVLNPPGGIIYNANNSIERPGDLYDFGDDYDLRYRADRIAEMLRDDPVHDVADSLAMQTDTLSPMAREMRPLLLAELAQAGTLDPQEAQAVALLRDWDDRMTADSPAPLIFTAWMRELNRELFADELGEDYEGWASLHPVQAARALGGATGWCDDVATAAVEGCAQQVREALAAALARLRAAHGEDIAAWRWGEAHRLKFRHSLFSLVPFLEDLLHTTAPAEGGNFTLNRGGMNLSGPDPFAKVHGAAYRAVYDLADLDRSLYSVVPGQSGNPFETDFSDKVQGWVDGRYFHIPAELPPDQVQTSMTLEPL